MTLVFVLRLGHRYTVLSRTAVNHEAKTSLVTCGTAT